MARVLVCYGGRSAEHGVSCLSARAVMAALAAAGHDVLPVGIARDGRWTLATAEVPPVAAGRLPEVAGDGPDVALATTADGPVLLVLDADGTVAARHPVDVAFPVLHGPGGEDGSVQGLFATLGLPFVGAGVQASTLAIDKGAMKDRFARDGLPQVAYDAFPVARWEADRAAVLADVRRVPAPWFVKPARQGSSIGISRVEDEDGLAAAVAAAAEHDDRIVVEEAVARPRELEVGVLEDDGRVEVSCVGEIVPAHEFYDFDAKYLVASRLDVPADVDPATAAAIAALARRAFAAVGARGMARVDCFLASDGRLLVNEINTIPGFTDASMFPRVWAASGVPFPELVGRLVAAARAAA
ncbi:MAG: D-alanine--D-alanine ligase family protein [Nitriliruptoraceae bacterium]